MLSGPWPIAFSDFVAREFFKIKININIEINDHFAFARKLFDLCNRFTTAFPKSSSSFINYPQYLLCHFVVFDFIGQLSLCQ
jgi:hypothetical protein